MWTSWAFIASSGRSVSATRGVLFVRDARANHIPDYHLLSTKVLNIANHSEAGKSQHPLAREAVERRGRGAASRSAPCSVVVSHRNYRLVRGTKIQPNPQFAGTISASR